MTKKKLRIFRKKKIELFLSIKVCKNKYNRNMKIIIMKMMKFLLEFPHSNLINKKNMIVSRKIMNIFNEIFFIYFK
jgi:hypothetical protein